MDDIISVLVYILEVAVKYIDPDPLIERFEKGSVHFHQCFCTRLHLQRAMGIGHFS